MPRVRELALVALSALVALLATSAAAEVRRFEGVGVFGVAADGQSVQEGRDQALRLALRDAVQRAALDLLAPEAFEVAVGGEEGTVADDSQLKLSPAAQDESWVVSDPIEVQLDRALGPQPLDYVDRYSTLEDRGQRPVLFLDDPEITSEYVLVAEVYVDTERVRQRLSGVGMALVPAGELPQLPLRVELLGLSRFDEFASVQQALLADPGVISAVPIEMARDRAVLIHETTSVSDTVTKGLRERLPEAWAFELLEIGHGHLKLQFAARPPETDPMSNPDPPEIDTTRRNRY